jgi:DNA ligase (NAD+)
MEPVFPATCPDCGTPLVKPEGEAKWFCPNTDGCPTQAKGKLVHFLSRKALNVIAGEATVEQLYNLDLVRTPADFFDLTPAKLSLLDGWKEKSIQRFLRSLADCRKVPFARVLFAIGIRYVGEQTAKDVAAHFGSIDTLAEASVEQLLEVPDIGDVTARAIYAWFREPAHQVEIQRLKAAGLQFSAEAPRENQSDALKGLTIVISGNFSISRDEMKELIERNGGKNSSGVSAKTTYLLAGSKPGPEKIRKAQELGVEIIDEARLMSMLPEHAGQEMSKTLFGDFEEPTLF